MAVGEGRLRSSAKWVHISCTSHWRTLHAAVLPSDTLSRYWRCIMNIADSCDSTSCVVCLKLRKTPLHITDMRSTGPYYMICSPLIITLQATDVRSSRIPGRVSHVCRARHWWMLLASETRCCTPLNIRRADCDIAIQRGTKHVAAATSRACCWMELISKSWIRPQQWSKLSYALRCQGRSTPPPPPSRAPMFRVHYIKRY